MLGFSLIALLFSILLIFVLTSKMKCNAFLTLIVSAFFYGLMSGMPIDIVVNSVKEGFGSIFYKTGLLYISGIVIGVVLEKTYAAYSIAQFVYKILGNRKIDRIAAAIGIVISVPINCDSGFIIMYPMCKGIGQYSGGSPKRLGCVLACGLMATHALVPPTAGPTSVASILQVELGKVIIYGLPIAILGVSLSIYISNKLGLFRFDQFYENTDQIDSNLQSVRLPNVAHALLPVLYPIFMICMSTFIKEWPTELMGNEKIALFFTTFGDPTLAMIVAMLLSFTLISKEGILYHFNAWINDALREAAVIILVNSAAGAFAEVISNSGIIQFITELCKGLPAGIGLASAFAIASIFKTAQGSSTVAMIATAGIMEQYLAESAISPTLLVLAIGAGSMVISHTNDSFFWVVSQSLHMDINEMLKHFTIPIALVGVCSFLIIFLLSNCLRFL